MLSRFWRSPSPLLPVATNPATGTLLWHCPIGRDLKKHTKSLRRMNGKTWSIRRVESYQSNFISLLSAVTAMTIMLMISHLLLGNFHPGMLTRKVWSFSWKPEVCTDDVHPTEIGSMQRWRSQPTLRLYFFIGCLDCLSYLTSTGQGNSGVNYLMRNDFYAIYSFSKLLTRSYRKLTRTHVKSQIQNYLQSHLPGCEAL